MADLHHLQDHFSNFQLNFSSLAKKKKNMQKERFEGKKGDLHCKICNYIKCLALHIIKVLGIREYAEL